MIRVRNRRRLSAVSTSLIFWVLCFGQCIAAVATNKYEPDTNNNCESWAERGECKSNPAYMEANCATACGNLADTMVASKEALAKVSSFFDLQATDISGNVLDFGQFRGQVTILTNVASFCGYTESHYRGLVELWGHLSQSKVNLLAFPCNQFGQQEPGTAEEIQRFATDKGVEFTLMQKINVNGANADVVYQYLKQETGLEYIEWNFATYFVVDPAGGITQHSGVEPMDLKGFALSLLNEEL